MANNRHKNSDTNIDAGRYDTTHFQAAPATNNDIYIIAKKYDRLDILADRYKSRNGGYTRIIKIGNRFGDNAPTAIIEFIDRDESAKGLDSGPVIEKKSTEEEVEQQPQI